MNCHAHRDGVIIPPTGGHSPKSTLENKEQEEAIPHPRPRPSRSKTAEEIRQIMSETADYCVIGLDEGQYVITPAEVPSIPIPLDQCSKLCITWVWKDLLEVSIHTDASCPPSFASEGTYLCLLVPRKNIECQFRGRPYQRTGETTKPESATAVLLVVYAQALNPSTFAIPRAIMD